jgi:hypothetical protein
VIRSTLTTLQSARHAWSFWLSRRLAGRLRPLQEIPAGTLRDLDAAEQVRVTDLHQRLGVDFAATLNATNARNCYAYLHLLDTAFRQWGLTPPRGGTVVDVGSASFWYASVLQVCFRPRRLVGVELDGYRRLRSGHLRRDLAAGYVANLGGEYLVADYTTLALPSDVVTAWFPFVNEPALLAWGLPLSALRPERLFAGVARNLHPGGWFFMVNQGEGEAGVAREFATGAGLRLCHRHALPLALAERTVPAVLTAWCRGASAA